MAAPKAPPLPSMKGFLIADQVFQQKSGKWCAIGIFDAITARKYPVMHPSLGIYVRLADAQGKYRVRVVFEDADGRTVSRIEGIELVITDRLSEPDFGFQASNLPIPKPGTYRFRLSFNDQLVTPDILLQAKLAKGTSP